MNGTIRETVCRDCNYRYRYNTQNDVTWCPICGATQFTRDIIPIRSVEEEDE